MAAANALPMEFIDRIHFNSFVRENRLPLVVSPSVSLVTNCLVLDGAFDAEDDDGG